MSFYRRYGKRALDLALVVPGLVVLSPFLLALWLATLVKLGSPAFYTQVRPGRGTRLFRMVKFRTMRDDRGPDGEPLPDEKRLVPFGRFLRSSSLDELPELWNVLKGEMSLVGPRPLLQEYLPRYNAEQARRHEVVPGVTGWAQVNGRNAISWEQKFEYDVWYVENLSFALDLRILGLTLLKVVKRADINAGDHATMPVFMGTRREDS